MMDVLIGLGHVHSRILLAWMTVDLEPLSDNNVQIGAQADQQQNECAALTHKNTCFLLNIF